MSGLVLTKAGEHVTLVAVRGQAGLGSAAKTGTWKAGAIMAPWGCPACEWPWSRDQDAESSKQ